MSRGDKKKLFIFNLKDKYFRPAMTPVDPSKALQIIDMKLAEQKKKTPTETPKNWKTKIKIVNI